MRVEAYHLCCAYDWSPLRRVQFGRKVRLFPTTSVCIRVAVGTASLNVICFTYGPLKVEHTSVNNGWIFFPQLLFPLFYFFRAILLLFRIRIIYYCANVYSPVVLLPLNIFYRVVQWLRSKLVGLFFLRSSRQKIIPHTASLFLRVSSFQRPHRSILFCRPS